MRKILLLPIAKNVGTEFGDICWNLLGEFQQTILRMDFLKEVQFEMQFSSQIYSIYTLHLSTFVIYARAVRIGTVMSSARLHVAETEEG